MGLRADENKALVRRFIAEVFNQGSLSAVDELVDTDWVGHDPAMSEELRGITGARQRHLTELYRSAFPDLTYTIANQVAEEDTVVTHWTARGTHQGELMGVSPSGKQVTIRGVSTDRISGGKLVESWDTYDASDILQQIGALLASEQTTEQPLAQEPAQAGIPASPETRVSAEGLPIEDYDSLNIAQIALRLGNLDIEDIERLQDYEAQNRNRVSLMKHFERRIRKMRAARRRQQK